VVLRTCFYAASEPKPRPRFSRKRPLLLLPFGRLPSRRAGVEAATCPVPLSCLREVRIFVQIRVEEPVAARKYFEIL
jgi:hypothetical protein